MPTNHVGTCAAAFLFLDGSAVFVFVQGEIGVYLRTRLPQATAAISGSSVSASILSTTTHHSLCLSCVLSLLSKYSTR